MKKRKKIITLLLTISLASYALAGCGNIQTGNNASGSDSDSDNASNGPAQVEEISYASLSADELQALYEQEEASQRTIHIGYDGGLCQAAIAVAYHYGFFTDEGLTTELTAAEDTRDALAGGLIDTSAGMIAQWLTSVQNGVDIRFTVGLHTGCAAAVTLPDSGITGFEAGQRIGVVGAMGGIYHNIGLRMTAHDGYTATDFTWLGFDAGAILLALQNGEVDVIVASEQLTQNWINEGSVSQIRSLTTDADFANEACCVMGISGSFMNANPVASYKITRAVYRASLWLAESEENRAEAARMLLENNYVSGTEEYALQLLNYYQFGLSNDIAEKSLYDSVDEYAQLGILDANADAEAFKARIWVPFDLDDLTQ